MKYEIIKLNFTSPLHLHRGKGDYDMSDPVLHSDTISSAICAAAYKVIPGFDSKELLDRISISSAFPYVRDVLFFPKPMVKLPLRIEEFDDSQSSREAKALKKIQYLDLEYFNRIIQAEEAFGIPVSHLKSKGQFLTEHALPPPFVMDTQQRVTVARDCSGSMPYYIERIHFAEQSGMFFLLDYGEDEDVLRQVLTALCFLGDEGLGTDRNVGNGFFEVERGTIDIEQPSSDARMILSLYCPTEEEVKQGILDDSAYQLIKRGGYIAGAPLVKHRHLKKKSIYMFAEASVFRRDTPPVGKVVNLRPDWDDDALPNIWRSGKPISIPIKTLKNG